MSVAAFVLALVAIGLGVYNFFGKSKIKVTPPKIEITPEEKKGK